MCLEYDASATGVGGWGTIKRNGLILGARSHGHSAVLAVSPFQIEDWAGNLKKTEWEMANPPPHVLTTHFALRAFWWMAQFIQVGSLVQSAFELGVKQAICRCLLGCPFCQWPLFWRADTQLHTKMPVLKANFKTLREKSHKMIHIPKEF